MFTVVTSGAYTVTGIVSSIPPELTVISVSPPERPIIVTGLSFVVIVLGPGLFPERPE